MLINIKCQPEGRVTKSQSDWTNNNVMYKNINSRPKKTTRVRTQSKQGRDTEHSFYSDIVLNITIANRTHQTCIQIALKHKWSKWNTAAYISSFLHTILRTMICLCIWKEKRMLISLMLVISVFNNKICII